MSFKYFVMGSGITDKKKSVLLLHSVGPEVRVLETLEDTGSDDDYDTAIKFR